MISIYVLSTHFPNFGDLEFAQENPQYIAANNSMDFLSNNGGQTYNLCHCESRALAILYRLFTYFSSDWSNFEIASLDFWRSKCKSILHSKSLLTERAIRRGIHIFLRIPWLKGWFLLRGLSILILPMRPLILTPHVLQRWGDAPVHSIAASLFASRDQVHFFSDIGYRHPPFQHCPQGQEWKKGKCSCDPTDSFGSCCI